MKVLLLVEDIKKISSLLKQNNDIKVIDEYEIIEDTPYSYGIVQPYYSDSLIKRASTVSKIYKFNKIIHIN